MNLLRLQPAFATWDLHSAEADSSILRAFSPEARLVVKASGEEVQPLNTSIDYDSPSATDSPAKRSSVSPNCYDVSLSLIGPKQKVGISVP